VSLKTDCGVAKHDDRPHVVEFGGPERPDEPAHVAAVAGVEVLYVVVPAVQWVLVEADELNTLDITDVFVEAPLVEVDGFIQYLVDGGVRGRSDEPIERFLVGEAAAGAGEQARCERSLCLPLFRAGPARDLA